VERFAQRGLIENDRQMLISVRAFIKSFSLFFFVIYVSAVYTGARCRLRIRVYLSTTRWPKNWHHFCTP